MVTTAVARIRPNFRENRLLQILVAWYVVFWIAMAISPIDRFDWFLENLLVFAVLALMVATYRIFPLSDVSYILITVFLTLHAVGAHYTYSLVPLGDWMKEPFGFERNHFDRIVHFSFGLLWAYTIREVFLRVATARGFFAYYFPLDVTLSLSAVFELIEWGVAIGVDPESGAMYLGMQGDIWDAQKDMAFAFTGATITMVVTAIVRSIWYRRPKLLGGVEKE